MPLGAARFGLLGGAVFKERVRVDPEADVGVCGEHIVAQRDQLVGMCNRL